MAKVMFNFDDAAEVCSLDGLSHLWQLPSFHAHYRSLRVGDRVGQTADWLCAGGVIYLIHDDPDQIAADIRAIRSWERRGELYGLAPIRETARAKVAAGGRS